MVSTGDGPVGASKLTGEVNRTICLLERIFFPSFDVKSTFETKSFFSKVLEIMGSLPETVKQLTGVDITRKIQAVR